MLETERKYLPKKSGLLDSLEDFQEINIKQGYLMITEDRHLRIRITDTVEPDVLCFKVFKSDTERLEYEYHEYDSFVADELYELCQYKLEKVRYEPFIGISVDVYPKFNYLTVIEIEKIDCDFGDELERSEWIEEWVGEEISAMKQYSNIELAKQQQC